jgi:predicted small metal-binding protein
MQRLDCPIDGCHATIEAETVEDVMTRVRDHAESKHPDLELDDETVASIRSKIQVV